MQLLPLIKDHCENRRPEETLDRFRMTAVGWAAYRDAAGQ